ncbi:DUF4878 domain-containing protein [Mycolicibacillus koreensis]|nr:DUF4878 domain-containing protein [Mycolicibacillus koreensis]
MANPTGSNPHGETTDPVAPLEHGMDVDAVTDRVDAPADPPTEILGGGEEAPAEQPERRFTAPGFDAGATQVLPPTDEPETEVFAPQSGKVPPQAIPPRTSKLPPQLHNSWGWVLAVTLIILALAAIAVLGTVLMTRDSKPKVASQRELVRETIHNFDVALQKGDLTTLRSITCGTTRDNYVKYDDAKWADIHQRVKKADRYPMVASIDEVVVNGEHAEANVTAYMAYAPSQRSTRSFDLQFRDDQWKICQAPAG